MDLATPLLTLLLFSVLVVSYWLRERPRIRPWWSALWQARMPAAAIALAYVLVLQANPWLGGGSLLARVGVTAILGVQVGSASLLGLALARRLSGFEPLAVRRKALGRFLLWAVGGGVLAFVLLALLGAGLTRLGVPGPTDAAGAFISQLRAWPPARVFLVFLSGAGFVEEVVYRLLLTTAFWVGLRSRGGGLVAGAAVFGLYHLSPLNSLQGVFWEYPVYQFLTSTAAGLFLGTIYLVAGLEAAIVAHTVSDFIGFVLSGMGQGKP